jgi:hypothetical protein
MPNKPANDMKANASVSSTPRARSNQRDTTMEFDGMINGSSQRATVQKYVGNQHTGHCNEGELIQMSQMPNRKGNVTSKTAGPATATGGKIDGGRKWAPSATMNYTGNPDRIQERQLYNSVGNKK